MPTAPPGGCGRPGQPVPVDRQLRVTGVPGGWLYARTVVGATFTGPGVQELLHSATVAICGGVTVDRLWHAVPSFPTISEVWLHLLEAYGL